MGIKTQRGFTIIETMLFVAITGALLITLLAGTAVSIQRQRYSDSVNSTQSFFQQQYNEVLNVVNSRQGQEACDSAENLVRPATGAAAEAPGASRCIVMGKAIEVPTSDADKNSLTTYMIVGNEPATVDSDASDDEIIRSYRPALVRLVGSTKYQIPWDAQIVGTTQDNAERTPVNRLLLIRSPKSGVTYSYSYNATGTDVAVSGGVTEQNRRDTLDVCVQSRDIVSAVSSIRVAMSGGPEAVTAAFDIDNATERCGL